MPRKISITDIARHLGLGRSTVQRALSNNPACNAATAERVRQAARELGYRPDPLFAAMGARQSRRSHDGIPLAYLVAQGGGVALIDMLAARARELGYKLDPIDLSALESPRRLWAILHARGYAGVLVGRLVFELAAFRRLMLDNDRFPLVCVGQGAELPFNTVRPAILPALREAWERMTALGYRRIGAAILRHDPEIEDDFSRLAGVVGCQTKFDVSGEAIPPLREIIGHDTDALIAWTRQHRPDAILGFSEAQYHILRSAGLRIPRDLGFACLHNTAESHSGEVAGMCQNFPLVATSAVNLLDQMIRHGECGVPENPITLTVPSLWLDGRSLPARKA